MQALAENRPPHHDNGRGPVLVRIALPPGGVVATQHILHFSRERMALMPPVVIAGVTFTT